MNHFGLTFLYLVLLFIIQLQLQLATCQDEDFSQDVISNYEPSLAMVIGILGFMFLLTFILVLDTKFCSGLSSRDVDQQIQPGLTQPNSQFSGIDKRVIESIPFFRFSSLKGSKEGLECAVCLSKFEDVEILRVLPICRHAFHIQCIDEWLENHSTCPLCRQKLNPEDSAMFTNPSNLRFLWNQSEISEGSDIEIFVQREEEDKGSSRFSVGGSFRIFEKVIKQDESYFQESAGNVAEDQKIFHKTDHKITISDIVFNNRWSDVSSADLEYLRSGIVENSSSNRFSAMNSAYDQCSSSRPAEYDETLTTRITERKRLLEKKFASMKNPILEFPSTLSGTNTNKNSIKALGYVTLGEKRSMSEITGVARYEDLLVKRIQPSLLRNSVNNERARQHWLHSARKTVQRFANRERRAQVAQNTTWAEGV